MTTNDMIRRWMLVLSTAVLCGAGAAVGQCPGDCNANGVVTVDEVVTAVNAALRGCDASGLRACPGEIIRYAEPPLRNPSAPINVGNGVLRLNGAVYQASGFGNTFMVVTREGNVIIDTSIAFSANAHRNALRAISDAPVRYIILTHAHQDHTGGVGLWKEAGTEVIAHANHREFLDFEKRLAPLFAHRNAAQFSLLLGFTTLPPFAPPDAPVDNHGGVPLATTTFEKFHEFRLGGLTFQLVHTPGETYDHLSVWIPEYKIAFPGDNYYISFPNLYTLRGTRPRWALDYVASLDTVLSWEPEVLAPSHGDPLYGRENIQQTLTQYRDAIQHVHDATVQGANAGKDVHTLMAEIELPPNLPQNEVYGNIPWSVRGIYEGYVGWFDANVSNMYSTPATSIYPDVVELAGGAAPLAARAAQLVADGQLQRAMHLADVVLTVDPDHAVARQAKRDAITQLREQSVNLNESGWLNAALIEMGGQ